MFEKQKLHKATLLILSYNRFKTIILPIAFYAVISLFESYDTSSLLTMLAINIFIFLLIFLFALIKYKKTSFWIDGNRLVQQTGLFVRKEKDIQISRIQSIDTNEDVIHRLLKVTKVSITTPGKGLTLDALSTTQYHELSDYLNQLKHSFNQETTNEYQEDTSFSNLDQESTQLSSESEEPMIFQLSISDIVKMTVFSSSFIRSFFIFIVGFNIIFDLPFDALFNQVGSLINQASIIILVAMIILSMICIYILGILFSIIQNYKYRVSLANNQLTIRKGLLETKSQTVPLKNVQTLEEKQNWLMHLFGYTSFSLSLTSDSLEEDDQKDTEEKEDGVVLLFPIVKTNHLTDLVQQCFPDYTLSPVETVVPVRSIRRFIQIPIAFWIIITLVINLFFWDYAWIIGLLLCLLSSLHGYLSYKLAGYHLSESEITIQIVTLFSLTKTYIPKYRILNLSMRQTPFLKRAQLAKVEIHTAHGMSSKESDLKFVEEKDALAVFEWFRNERSHYHDD